MTKIALTLTASLAVIGDIIALLEDNGFGDTIPDGATTTQSATPETATVTPAAGNAPTTVAVTSSPNTDTSTISTVSADVELDSKGIPWDERIHSAKKTQKSDKSWTRRRNVPDEVFNAVEAELRAAMSATAPDPVGNGAPVVMASGEGVAAPVTSEIPLQVAPVAVEPVGTTPASPASPTPVNAPTAPNAAPVAPSAPVAPTLPVGPPETMHDLMAHLAPLMQNGTIDPTYLVGVIGEINEAWKEHGVSLTSVTDIGSHPQVIPYIWQIFQRDKKVA